MWVRASRASISDAINKLLFIRVRVREFEWLAAMGPLEARTLSNIMSIHLSAKQTSCDTLCELRNIIHMCTHDQYARYVLYTHRARFKC